MDYEGSQVPSVLHCTLGYVEFFSERGWKEHQEPLAKGEHPASQANVAKRHLQRLRKCSLSLFLRCSESSGYPTPVSPLLGVLPCTGKRHECWGQVKLALNPGFASYRYSDFSHMTSLLPVPNGRARELMVTLLDL